MTKTSTRPDHRPGGTHEHPQRVLALRTRTRLLGTWNFAVALSGRSCGWGSCARPRRTVVGHVKRRRPDTGRHFAELVISRGMRDRVLLGIGRAA